MARETPPHNKGHRRLVLKRLSRDRVGLFGILLVATIALSAVMAPWIAPHDPTEVQLGYRFKPMGTPDFPLGADPYGRDMLSRLLWGGRVSLYVGIVATLIAMGFGIIIGVLSGYYGGKADLIIMRVMDVLLAFPYILLAIVIVAILGPNLLNALIAVAITGIPFYVRIMRGLVLSVKELPYVEGSVAAGARTQRIIWFAILPSIFPYIIVAFSINVGWLILEAAALSFLGLGAQPPTAEWGAMLAEARQYVTVAPHTVILPGLAILATVIGFNLFGDALRDALDVKLSGREAAS